MEIISNLVKIKVEQPFDNEVIEKVLVQMGFKPLRWAIVGIDDSMLTVSLAYEKL